MPSDESVNGDGKDVKREDPKKSSSSSSRKDNGDRDRGKDVCRDFLNNICNRGSRCKFFHPTEENDKKVINAAEEPYNFCIDFQNQGCHRDNCRYVHAFREDVDRYKRTGDVTLGLARSLAALMRGDQINGIPLCKEFQNGHCARGPQCRYWHINKDEERRKRFTGRPGGGGRASPGIRPFGAYHHGPPAGGIRRRDDDYSPYDDYGPPSKRAAYGIAPVMAPLPVAPAPATRVIVDMERRNAELVAEVESLKRELLREKERYDDLMALFRATQANQSASIQQQRSVHPLNASSTPGSANQQPAGNIPSLGGLSAQQQWTPAPGTASNYLGSSVNAYDWTAN